MSTTGHYHKHDDPEYVHDQFDVAARFNNDDNHYHHHHGDDGSTLYHNHDDAGDHDHYIDYLNDDFSTAGVDIHYGPDDHEHD